MVSLPRYVLISNYTRGSFFCSYIHIFFLGLAYRAAQYVQSLMENGAIVPEGSDQLDKIYEEFRRRGSDHDHAQGLLRTEGVSSMVERMGLKGGETLIYRALDQCDDRRQRREESQ